MRVDAALAAARRLPGPENNAKLVLAVIVLEANDLGGTLRERVGIHELAAYCGACTRLRSASDPLRLVSARSCSTMLYCREGYTDGMCLCRSSPNQAVAMMV